MNLDLIFIIIAKASVDIAETAKIKNSVDQAYDNLIDQYNFRKSWNVLFKSSIEIKDLVDTDLYKFPKELIRIVIKYMEMDIFNDYDLILNRLANLS